MAQPNLKKKHMSKFEPLTTVLAMDFTQMRAKKQADINCATDDAIRSFVSCFSDFFAQFTSRPSEDELKQYQSIMEHISQRISSAEVNYYTNKYTLEGYSAEKATHLASFHALKGYQGIPTRMQYWAAGEQWGETIRNAEMHAAVVNQMNQWARWIDSPVRTRQTVFSFGDSEEDLSFNPATQLTF